MLVDFQGQEVPQDTWAEDSVAVLWVCSIQAVHVATHVAWEEGGGGVLRKTESIVRGDVTYMGLIAPLRGQCTLGGWEGGGDECPLKQTQVSVRNPAVHRMLLSRGLERMLFYSFVTEYGTETND